MKTAILFVLLFFGYTVPAQAQFKETAQLATLSPAILVVYSTDIETYHKHHYLISTIGYMGSYMVLESKWKAALLTLGLGITKELVYDGLLNKGTPLWSDMKWNALGVTQGLVFTFTLEF